MRPFLALIAVFNLSLVAPTYAAKGAAANELVNLLEDEKNNISIFERSVFSVVNVSNIKKAGNWFYGMVDVPAGAGSGFVWDDSGHIVTNFHVVQEGDSFVVTFHKDTKQYKAKLVGAEPKKDIAVLKLLERPKNLYPITVGVSKNLKVGQKTLAIGNPFGLDHTLTKGSVSALERKIMGVGGVKIHDMIQTDASINPGNSGGPLLNSSGELIGMNTLIYSSSGSSAGLGFAVPVDTINRIVPQLIKHGKIIRPGLGIGVLPDQVKERYFGGKGVVISYLDDNGPAAKAGLQGMSQDRYGRVFVGDIILSINDREVNSLDDIYHLLEDFKIGELVTVKYKRLDNGKERILSTKLKLESI